MYVLPNTRTTIIHLSSGQRYIYNSVFYKRCPSHNLVSSEFITHADFSGANVRCTCLSETKDEKPTTWINVFSWLFIHPLLPHFKNWKRWVQHRNTHSSKLYLHKFVIILRLINPNKYLFTFLPAILSFI